MSRPDRGREVVVIGSGVTGLTSALCLVDRGFSVRVQTAAPAQETTSRVAGAMWGSTFAGPVDKVEGWAATSLEVFRQLASDPDSGVRMASGTLASRGGQAPPPNMFPGVEVHRSEPSPGFMAAFRVTLPLIDMPRYLSYLEGRARDEGVDIELKTVRSLDDVLARTPIVVNCAGLGARELVPDPSVRPVRGQHVIVENPGLDEFFMTEPFGPSWTSWFPHQDRVVLGGVAQDGDWDLEPRTADAEQILEGCAALEPRLRGARVLEHQVGLRPARDTIRLEAQRTPGGLCVHSYGHGGTGVGLSWGCARELAALVDG